MMRNTLLVLILGTVFALSACSSTSTPKPPPNPNPGVNLSGTYNGELVVGNSDPFVSTLVTFTVDAKGSVSGVTTGTANSGAPGEKGTLTGKVEGTSPLELDFTVTFSSPTLGTYGATGKGVYSGITRDLAAQLTAKDAAGVFVGDFLITSKKE